MMNKKSTVFRKTFFSARSPESTSMIYLCRFRQRTRLIEVPAASEYYHQQNGITHEHLRHLIVQEFQLQQTAKATLIIQLWNEQYQEYIDIESFKRIPLDGRLQVLIEKEFNVNEDSPSKSPSTAVSSQTTSDLGLTNRNPRSQDEVDVSPQMNIKIERIYDEPVNTFDQHNLIYDLLPKPVDGIPIPRFPPHIAAFLNGNGDANQLNALVQALYQEIVKYELYPNADELRSIVSRLVDRYPHCITVVGSIELLVRKLYYKFCNERKKYPVELKRRQPNKRKRLLRDDDLSMTHTPAIFSERQGSRSNDFHHSSLDHLMHLWTNAQQSGSSSNSSSSPIANNPDESQKYHPLNLSISTNNNLICME